jgi:hypothetical protein
MCEKCDEAIEPRPRKINADYAKRYRWLISRHELEFKDLFTHLNSLIKTLKGKAEEQKSAVMALLNGQKASNAGLSIESVAQQKISQRARDAVIRAFSPRNRKAPPLKI